ncbi:YIP1 family protein [Bacillus sp. Xin]|uniref:YIP1 family protein n=1 Tax=unclassified Bacillus (in: firmicutes) TaxID=185979 RepID=UPI0015726820|nr:MULTISPECIES: YIP1 family protein [unclassified Bacillus (in: firmicutes)]MBC6972753.1 YIP1 family protein [Bacillus sp. Xin]NSW38242.1 YIP1 family protein [Bacillus sp. Xin1]
METNTAFKNDLMKKPSLFSMITSPALQFQRMRTHKPIIVPLFIILLLTIITSALFSYVTLNNPAIKQMNSNSAFQIPTHITFLTTFGFTAVSGIISVFFAPIFYKNIMIFFGVDTTYKELLCVTLYSVFIMKLGMLLNGTIAILLGNYQISYTSLASLLTDNLILHAMAQRIDVFAIWYYIVLGIGLYILTELHKKKVMVLVIVLFIITTALMSIGGIMQGITQMH